MSVHFTFRQLEYFVAVCETGSVKLASERVNVSSPSISASISQLEESLGFSLFQRIHAQGMSLTLSGHLFLEQARKVLREGYILSRMASDITEKIQGQLKLGCLSTFAQLVVPTLRRGFEKRYRDVKVSQIEQDQIKLFNLLRNAEIDIALTYDLNIPSDLVFYALAELPPYALVDENHPLSKMEDISLRDLRDYPMVLLDLPLSADYFLSCFIKLDIQPKITEKTRDMAVMRSLVANGFGYSIANIRPLTDVAPDGGKLCFIPLRDDVPALRMGLLALDGFQNILMIQAFLEHCKTAIENNAVPGITFPSIE